jgi:hypothetical protein
MADERGAYAMFAIKGGLERKQAQHQVHGLADGANPTLPPGPHLRTHVLHGFETGAFQLARQAKIEFLVVDADEHVGPPVNEPAAQLRAQAQQTRQVGQHFGETHDGQGFDVVPGLAPRGAHPGSRDAGVFGVRKAALQCGDERGAQRISRGFARHQCNTQEVSPGQLNARGCASTRR